MTLLLIPLAAQAAAPSPAQPPDIVTVVGRAPAPLESLPLSIDVVTDEAIDEQAILSVTDALSLLPGVQVVRAGPFGTQASVFLRGTDSDHVLSTYDGIRLNSPATPNGAYSFGSDLSGGAARIEVLRGPASATYGSDAIGGVINVVPRIEGEPGGSASLSAGELETYAGGIDHAGEAGPLRFALSAQAYGTDGYDAVPGRISEEVGSGDRDGSDAYSASAAFAYVLTEEWSLEAIGLHRQAEAGFDTFSGGPTGLQRASDPDLSSEDRLSVARAGIAYEGAATLRLRAGIVDAAFEERDGEALTGEVDGQRRFSELLAGREGKGWRLNGGLIAEQEKIDIPVSFNDPLKAEEDHFGGFLFGQRDWGALTLTGALRADDYEGFGTPVTYNAGAVWTPSQGLRLHAAYGTAYNIPTLSERFSTSAFTAANPDLEEEQAESGEIGVTLERRVAAGVVGAGLVLFRTETEDLIEYAFATGQNVNIGDARTQGAELSVHAELERFSGRLAYTYTDAENRDTGTDLLRRPEHGFAASANWQATDRLALSGRWSRVGERLDVTYSDDGNFLGNGEVGAFDEAAVAARYALRTDLTGFVTVTNLLDETYEQPAGFGSAPRLVRLGLRKDW